MPTGGAVPVPGFFLRPSNFSGIPNELPMGAHVGSDHELWERIKCRDEDAFEAFYRENAARLCAFLRQVVGSPQAAEDLMQETFTQMWRSPNGFRPERGSLRSYVFGIGRKRAADWRRKR